MNQPTRLPCTCQQCRLHPNGFIRQTKQVIKKHRALYDLETSAGAPLGSSQAASPSSVPILQAPNDFSLVVDLNSPTGPSKELYLHEDDFGCTSGDDFEEDEWYVHDNFSNLDLDVGFDDNWNPGHSFTYSMISLTSFDADFSWTLTIFARYKGAREMYDAIFLLFSSS